MDFNQTRRLHILAIALCLTLFLAAGGFSLNRSMAASLQDAGFKASIVVGTKRFVYEDKPLKATNHLVEEEIYARKINASFAEKRALVGKAIAAGASYERAATICMPLLKNTVDEIEKYVFKEAQDASITFNPDAFYLFTIKREKKGVVLDREKLFQSLVGGVRSNNLNLTVYAPTIDTEAKIKSDSLVALTKLKSEFSTNFDAANEGRASNIALALSKINGFVLAPGEEFSFNKTVGRRTESNGFKKAKIIMDGEYVEGLGGGVCQASTTVYNAALCAGMEITKVRNHSLMGAYVKPSLDAMVNSHSSDLKFKNPLKTQVFIKAWAENGRACVKIYGEKNLYRIETESVLISSQPPPDDTEVIDAEHKYLPPDTPSGVKVRVSYGKGSLKSKAYLNFFDENNNLVERKLIRNDFYAEQKGIIAVAP